MQKKLIACLAFILAAILLTLCFIFGNSLKGKEESAEQSGFFVDILKPLIDPENNISEEDFDFFLRKAAHFTEFAFLGAELTLLALALSALFKKPLCNFLGYSLFFALIFAVADEFIQSFTGRGSLISDVLIDFSGSIVAFAIVLLIYYCFKHRKNHLRKVRM